MLTFPTRLGGPAYPAQLATTSGLTRPNVSNHLACAWLDVVLAVDDGQPCIDEVPLPPCDSRVHQ